MTLPLLPRTRPVVGACECRSPRVVIHISEELLAHLQARPLHAELPLTTYKCLRCRMIVVIRIKDLPRL